MREVSFVRVFLGTIYMKPANLVCTMFPTLSIN